MNRGRPREFDVQEALRSAMLIFWRKGYRHTSIEDLTDELGISRPSLYAAFGDKAALFRLALNLYVEEYGTKIAAELNSSPLIMTAIAAFLRKSLACFSDTSLPGGCLVGVHAGDTELDPAVRDQLKKISQLTENALTMRFRTAIESEEIGESQSASKLAALTYCVLSGLSQAARSGASRRKLNGIVDSFLNSLENLIY